MHTDLDKGENLGHGNSLSGRMSTDRNDSSRRRLWVNKEKGRLKGLGAWEFSCGF